MASSELQQAEIDSNDDESTGPALLGLFVYRFTNNFVIFLDGLLDFDNEGSITVSETEFGFRIGLWL